MTPFLGEVVGTLLLIVLGTVLVWLTYLPHWALTADPEAKLGVLCTAATGYAINPARDFGPRLAHAVLPIPGKRDADWGYAWIPIVGPVVGGVVGALVFRALWAA